MAKGYSWRVLANQEFLALFVRKGRLDALQEITYSLYCSSFLGLPCSILNMNMVKPEKGTTVETIGSV